MRDLQTDIQTVSDGFGCPHTTHEQYEALENVEEAARKYANPDMEAAARFYSAEVGRRSGSTLTWEAMYEEEQADFLRVSTGAVNAALGVTEAE